jgi:hypothetical protein
MDTPGALAELGDALDTWAARDAAVVVTAPTPDSVRATRCVADSGSDTGTGSI